MGRGSMLTKEHVYDHGFTNKITADGIRMKCQVCAVHYSSNSRQDGEHGLFIFSHMYT